MTENEGSNAEATQTAALAKALADQRRALALGNGIIRDVGTLMEHVDLDTLRALDDLLRPKA